MTDSYYAFFGEKHPPIRCKKNLLRFQIAQDRDYENALREIKQGQKKSHWIWYVFPQLEGLGSSSMCKKYGIMGLQEAKCYLLNPILRERLVQISKAVHNKLKKGVHIEELMGSNLDARKLVSSMTLFREAAGALGEKEKEYKLFSDIIAKSEKMGYPECHRTLKIIG